ncbi:MAG TPA: tetratricopeptide repeat protein, partial [Thermoanaerobaculia bacterium]|nr:tetratricopeptide repeat protein [Thermoanaerobaculia bacterium]
MADALVHLQAAFKLNPDDLSTGIAVSQLLVSNGKAAEAERVLAQLVERAPDQRAINYNYAQVLTRLGRGDESKQYLERAVQLDPTFGPAILGLIDIYQKENEWRKAAEILNPLIEEDPINIELKRQQAFFYLRADLPEEARKRFKDIVAADPRDARSQFYLAESLNDLQQFAEAAVIYKKLLNDTPDDPDILASYALNQIGQKNWDEAQRVLNSLLALPEAADNLTTLARTQLALIDLNKGNYEAAIATAKPVFIFRDKPNVQAINIALDALKKQKKYAEGVALLQPLVDKFGNDPFLNARYVELLARSGASAKAQQASTVGAKFGSRNAIAIAEAWIATGDSAKAIEIIKSALQEKDKADDLDLQFELGSAYERSGDRPAAEKAFLSILEKHPEHGATLNYLGYMWAEGGVNLDRAQEMLTRAVTQDPRNGAYIDSLGWVYFRKGDLENAEKLLNDATHLLPRDATVHEHLGDVYAKRGDDARALKLYRVALTLEPEPKDEEKLRLKIAEIERKAQTSAR